MSTVTAQNMKCVVSVSLDSGPNHPHSSGFAGFVSSTASSQGWKGFQSLHNLLAADGATWCKMCLMTQTPTPNMKFCQPVSCWQPFAVKAAEPFPRNPNLPWTVLGVCSRRDKPAHKPRQGRPQANYPEMASFWSTVLQSRGPGGGQHPAAAQSNCTALKRLRGAKGNNCCAEATCPAEQLHPRCDPGEAVGCLANFWNTNYIWNKSTQYLTRVSSHTGSLLTQ